MTVREFLSDRLGYFILHIVFAAAAGVFLLLTGTASGILLLLLIVWLLVFFFVQMVNFFQCRSRLLELEGIMNGLDQKYLFAECIADTKNCYERRLFALFRKAGRSMIRSVSDAQAAQREYREYVESWVHEMKTPITAARLICRNTDPKTRQKFSQELAQIEAHVERALFYARAESPEKDFMITQVCLAEIADQAIQNHRTLLMQSGVHLEIKDLEQIVYTDSKWAAFILGQLLQNAVRYRGEDPKIQLKAKQVGQQVQLSVQDNGMGIPLHEVSRVFARGFTGSNGRTRGGSTGMGLYLCDKLADCLEMKLQISSEVNKGTKVTVIFPAKENLTNL